MVRFKRLGYVALNVSDVARSIAFYRDVVDLNLTSADADRAFLRCSEDHHSLALYRAGEPGLRRVAFEVESAEEFEAARERLASRLQILEPPPHELEELGVDRAFRLVDPAGVEVELFHGMRKAGAPYKPQSIKIERLGHCVIGAENHAETVKFYTDVLGFKISDEIDGVMSFMRCFPNPLHHSFGVAKRPETGLHHINFMVTDIDDIGRGRNRLLDKGVEIAFGPGRHLPSGSIFLYFLDPDGIVAEWSFGMEGFSEQDYREPRTLARDPLVLDTWGGRPGPGFGGVRRKREPV